MAEAPINERCIIGMPTCGYAFSSSRMAFIAAPADEEFQLAIDILLRMLQEKEYEGYVALQNVDPAKFAFCTKICSKIITSQFCVVILNPSIHRLHPDIRMPNPNVHLEYGLMLAFRKHIIPLQREGEDLPFNIRPLDTVLYTKKTFQQIVDRSIDNAILNTATTSRPTRAIASDETLLRYLAICGLRVTELLNEDAKGLYRLGGALGFYLLDGPGQIVYFGMFDLNEPKDIVFRVKLLLQNLHNAYQQFRNIQSKSLDSVTVERAETVFSQIRIEVLASDQAEIAKIVSRVQELTFGFQPFPWKIVTAEDLDAKISGEYALIGEI